MYSTAEFKKGLKIEIDGIPYIIVDFQHVKPGKGGAFVRTKLKNLLNGRVVDQTFRSGEKVDKPDLMEREMQYLYREGDRYCMMDNETYEQIMLTEEQVVGTLRDLAAQKVKQALERVLEHVEDRRRHKGSTAKRISPDKVSPKSFLAQPVPHGLDQRIG